MASSNSWCVPAVAVMVAASAALVARAQDGVPVPGCFERVLWCSDAAGGPAIARAAGFTAVQLGRGGDPQVVTAHGLRFYLDQPVGKGLLELRDEQWTPVRLAYERTRDPAVLVRPECFAAPGRVEQAAAAAAAEAHRVAGPGLLFVALADEASATRHNAPLDTCRCAHCLAAFRRYVANRFGGLDAVNAALGTHFTALDEVVPPTTDQVRRRELGERDLPRDLRPYAAWLGFVDQQFSAAIAAIAGRVRAVVPEVPVGLTGLQPPAPFGGHDYRLLLPHLTLLEPYDIGGAAELARSAALPGAHRYETLALPAADSFPPGIGLHRYVRSRFAAMAAAGLAGVVVWNDAAVRDGNQPSAFGRAVTDALQHLGSALDACAGATVEPAPIWLIESQPSVQAWWMLDSAGDGMTWVRRLASYERDHSTSQATRRGWIRLLQDLGFEPEFVAEASLAERLLLDRPRCVVLPATIALAERTAQVLAVYVRNGGHVVADHSTGLYDERLLRRDRGALDDLFGISSRSLAWPDLLVREGRSVQRNPGPLPAAENALRGALGERQAATDLFLEHVVGRGRCHYLNTAVVEYPAWRLDEAQVGKAYELRRRLRSVLQRAGAVPPCEVRGEGLPTCVQRTPLRLRDGRRMLAIRLNALDRLAALGPLVDRGPLAVEVAFAATRRLRVFGSDATTESDRLPVALDAFGLLLVEDVR